MEYKYLDSLYNKDDIVLPSSDRIDRILLKNNSAEVMKAIEFFKSQGKLLYIHGFLGTGKRQFINYITEFLNKDIIILEYYCKPSTVCDDILLSFIDVIEKNSLAKAVSHTAKVTTLAVKFQQYISSIKKPFVIILHSYDDILKENLELVSECIIKILNNNDNVKLVFSTRAMLQNVFGDIKVDKKIFLKALSKEIFREFISSHKINGTDEACEEFYKYSRGYYYYTILAIKVMLAMNLTLNDFLSKFKMSGMNFDSYLGATYINLIPNTIKNFFWFLRTIRHGVSVNALAVLGLYDDFSLGYLKNNLMIFQTGELIYVQDYFQQDIDISIPTKTDIKLHKYIINLYEKELKESLQTRTMLISRQALRAEIEYHKQAILALENPNLVQENHQKEPQKLKTVADVEPVKEELDDLTHKITLCKKLSDAKKYTEAIEMYLKIVEEEKPDENSLAEIRVELGRLYKLINDFEKSKHYYELAEKYYKGKEEYINLNYLYYELTSLYFDMYKTDRAIETIKKVIYSVDTPQSLMVDSCTLLGNIYSEIKNYDEASKYYQKALESIDENEEGENISELYFKYALMCDENGDSKMAYEYYNKCISLNDNSPYKSLAYSNIGTCYYESGNLSDAEFCFEKSYNIEKTNNNYEGIYYTSSYLAKIYEKTNPSKVLKYLIEAKQSAEFINEDFYILEATVALGDYYYDHKDMMDKALTEYFSARKIAQNYGNMVDIEKIDERINDMKQRIDSSTYKQLEESYG